MKKILVVAIIFVVALGIYFKISKKPVQTKLQKITIMMPFTPDISYAAYYAAKYNGYYKNEGLDVDFQYSTKGSVGPIEQLAAGKVDIIHTSTDALIMSRSKNIDLIAVYPISPANLFYIVSNKDKNITKPADLIGKKVGVISSASSGYLNLSIISSLSKLDIKGINIVQVGTSIVPAFLEGKIDAAAVFLVEKYFIEQENPDLNIIKAADYSNVSNNHLIVMNKLLKNNSGLVNKFIIATKKGVEYVLQNPKETVNIYSSLYPEAKSQSKLNLDLLKVLVQVHYFDTSPPYTVSDWQKSQNLLFSTGLITKKTDVSSMFTNKFIPK